jgi:hypothetical protein
MPYVVSVSFGIVTRYTTPIPPNPRIHVLVVHCPLQLLPVIVQATKWLATETTIEAEELRRQILDRVLQHYIHWTLIESNIICIYVKKH